MNGPKVNFRSNKKSLQTKINNTNKYDQFLQSKAVENILPTGVFVLCSSEAKQKWMSLQESN